MADEPNIPSHRWYQDRYHIGLPMEDVSEAVIKAAGIRKIDHAIVSPLFAASEQGVWFDPSDLNTLFQDINGVTPVTAAGQPVGLMLDKSKGLSLGSELITNGDFSNGLTGWLLTGVGNTTVVSGGVAQISGTSSVGLRFASIMTLGNTYRISLRIRRTSGSAGVFYTPTIATAPTLTTEWQTVTFYAVAANANFEVGIAGTATGTVVEVDDISVKLLAGNHATQSGDLRPTYQIDSTGRPYLSFDGVDDGMVTNTITPAIDKVQVFAGLRKLSDAAQGMLAELSSSATANNGAFFMVAPATNATADYAWRSKGTVAVTCTSAATYVAPITNVMAGIGDISGDISTLRINSLHVETKTADQGTGNYLAYPLYIGRRGGASLPFNGRLYSLIVRFGTNLTDAQITSTEAWVNAKTGAY